MKSVSYSGLTLRAVSGALPEQQVTQQDFAGLYGEQEVARISKSTGIHAKRKTDRLTTSRLIEAACLNIFDRLPLSADHIDALIVVTQTPDAWSPGVGYLLHGRLGLSPACLVFDLNAGCGGYITGLLQASALITSATCKRVLLCTGDVTTKLLDDDDRHVTMLFGDGASATLLEQGEDNLTFVCGADGKGYSALGTDLTYSSQGVKVHPLHMDGTAVMNFALLQVPAAINTLLSVTGIEKSELDQVVLHQANAFMLNYLRRILRLSEHQLPIDVDGIGNTSSSSIPLVLSRGTEAGLVSASKTILCGFGVGLSWGAVLVNLEKTLRFAPVIVPEEASIAAEAAQ